MLVVAVVGGGEAAGQPADAEGVGSGCRVAFAAAGAVVHIGTVDLPQSP